MRTHALLIAAALAALIGALVGSAPDTAARTSVSVNDQAVLEGIPRQLSDYGFFVRPRAQESLQAVSYRLNTPLYSDGADKLRFVYVPAGKRIVAGGEGLLRFPVGTALIKTFAFGEGADRRLIETCLLLHREDGWTALPYLWNDEQTDAKLALAGARIPITTPDGEEISYRVPNKNQCKQCHSLDDAVTPIGPKARNLDIKWLEQMVVRGQLNMVPVGGDSLPDWHEREGGGTAPLARAYLDVNCAHCHQPGGMASNSGLDLRWEQDDPHAIGIRKPPVAAGRGAGGLLVSIEPGAPERSIVIHRMSSTDPGVAMPELGKSTVDKDGLAVLTRWITEMEKQ